jgi:hypothetical protein
MPIAFPIPKTKAALQADVPSPVWIYVMASFICMTAVVGVAALAKSHWGTNAPALFGFAGAVISVHFAAWLFARTQRRSPLAIERQRLVWGCFLAFWFYDEFLRIAVKLANHADWTGAEVLTAILATVFDFTFVWAIFRYSAPWLLRGYTAREPPQPPNQRLERP